MVAIARGIHLLPFRTEKLSPFTPMVLPQGGRVGSRLSLQLKACSENCRPFFILIAHRCLAYMGLLRLLSSLAIHHFIRMQKLLRHKLIVELIWWFLTLILILLVLFPIWMNAPRFPFYFENSILIAAFVTFTRYIFLLPITLIARQKWIKVFVILFSAILFFVMTTALSDFHNFLDEEGLQTLVNTLNVNAQTRLINYMKGEMIFFGVGAIIAGIILPFRMIISLWRIRNRGTV